jgi:DNA-binding MltR family transcriptional regulator
MTESDLGCLLIATTLLNDMLDEKIRAKFSELSGIDRKYLDFLFEPKRGPLGSFGVKIVVARASGVIDNRLHSTLSKIQEFRNPQAHTRTAFSFTKNAVKAITQQLGHDVDKLIFDFAAWFKIYFDKLNPFGHKFTVERLAFIWAVATILNLLRPMPTASPAASPTAH